MLNFLRVGEFRLLSFFCIFFGILDRGNPRANAGDHVETQDDVVLAERLFENGSASALVENLLR